MRYVQLSQVECLADGQCESINVSQQTAFTPPQQADSQVQWLARTARLCNPVHCVSDFPCVLARKAHCHRIFTPLSERYKDVSPSLQLPVPEILANTPDEVRSS